MNKLPEITLVGHPFAPIGMGENVRSAFRAWRAAYVPVRVLDIYRLNKADPDIAAEFEGHMAQRLTSDIQIFHINGDEVAQALGHIAPRAGKRGKRIICPAWELSRYPDAWAQELNKFDEVWAQSRFTYDCLKGALSVPVVHMTESCEIKISSFLSRRYFGIPESSYTFLFFFDFASYAERKNALGVVAAFEKFLAARPHAATTLIIKLNGASARPDEFEAFKERLAGVRNNVCIINSVMSDNEIKNLVRNCDCFVSLHRAEGFGRGVSESMRLGKPVIATAYSGNMDFMAPETSLLVDYQLIPVGEDMYPHWQDQVWADPDIDHASRHMVSVYDDPDFGRRLGARARDAIGRDLSYRACGLRYRLRVESLLDNDSPGAFA